LLLALAAKQNKTGPVVVAARSEDVEVNKFVCAKGQARYVMIAVYLARGMHANVYAWRYVGMCM